MLLHILTKIKVRTYVFIDYALDFVLLKCVALLV